MNKKMIDNHTYINSTVQEAFSFLSTNLALKDGSQKPKIISINSFMPGEGKTKVAINTAIAVARSGANTLLIDADLRKTSHSKHLNEEPAMGLTDYFLEMNFNEIICPTSIKNLSFVDSGMKLVDPIEFLCGDSYLGFLEKVSLQYDMIIVDCPPSGKCVDGSIIASKASGALIITSANKTSYKNIERMKWQMENVGANIIGVVINRENRSDYASYFIAQK